MLINLTTDFSYLLDREIVTFNHQDTFGSKPEIINYCSEQADKNEWSYIFLPWKHNNPYIDLTDFLTLHADTMHEYLPAKTDTLKNLRILFLAEESDSFFIVDIAYGDRSETEYVATEITIYDGREYIPAVEHKFELPQFIRQYQSAVKFHMFERRLDVELAVMPKREE